MKKVEKEVVQQNDYRVVLVVLLIAGLFTFLLFTTGPTGKYRAAEVSPPVSQPRVTETPTGAVVAGNCQEWSRNEGIWNLADYGYDVTNGSSEAPDSINNNGSVQKNPATLYFVGSQGSLDKGDNIWIKKQDVNGAVVWTKIYDNPNANRNDIGRGIASNYKYVYVTGSTQNKRTKIDGSTFYDTDTLIQKRGYSDGYEVWTTSISNQGIDEGHAIAVAEDGDINSNGKIIVAGTRMETNTMTNTRSQDIHIFRLANAGIPAGSPSLQWSKTYAGNVVNGTDEGNDIAIVPPTVIYGGKQYTGGNAAAVVVGYVTNVYNLKVSNNIWIQLLNTTDGKPFWTRTVGSPAYDDVGASVTIDRFGSIYLAGYQTIGLNNKDLWIAKMLLSGGFVWSKTFDVGKVLKDDEGYGITVDEGQNLYVTGRSWNVSRSAYDAFTMKLDTNGNQLWTKKFLYGNGNSVGNGVALSSEISGNNVFVAGVHPVNANNIWMQKYCNS